MDCEASKQEQALMAVVANPARNFAGDVLTFCGLVMCLSSLGLWVQPENLAEPGAMTMRALLTCFLSGIGYMLFKTGRTGGDEFAIDIESGRLFQLPGRNGGFAGLQRHRTLKELEVLEFAEDTLLARTKGGSDILRVAFANPLPQAALDRFAARRKPSIAI
ncbi:hypothetical protein [Thalassovita aquimarina]|uniref:PH domain-containing protein n=1 Tax=Thalassovita aquimarina TaxID=2785917 RepID=A0ABS5HS18_9RHOB|nr:hypothetical protein [Thalassovita aquimarina]MBR9651771.1 hypothetical protein [Thalassovita aquimarina]